jgi:hypothetical protein
MDEKNILQEAEEILHVFHHPDADVYVVEKVQPTIVDSSPTGIAHVPPAMPVIVTVLVALLLPLASILFQLFLLFHPLTASILVKAQQVTSLAHVHTLPPVTITQSQIVTTTGHRHIAASQATGVVTFYNASTQQQSVDAGTLLVGRDGEQVIIDQTAYIPAGNLNSNGVVSVMAHAVDYGPAGNIAADDIYGACCRLLVQAVNSPFSGGHNAKDYPVVMQSDIATATSNLLAQENVMLEYHILPDETLLTPVPCITHTTSNHRAGDEAAQVTVTVRQDCTPSAYNPHAIQSSLIQLVARKTKQDALHALLALKGVSSAAINWPDDMKLPPAPYIHLDILVPGGTQ